MGTISPSHDRFIESSVRRAWNNDSLLIDGLRAQKALQRRGRSRSDRDSQKMLEEARDVTGSVAWFPADAVRMCGCEGPKLNETVRTA